MIRYGRLLKTAPIKDITDYVDPYRFAVEDRVYPRRPSAMLLSSGIVHGIVQVNTEKDLKNGYKELKLSHKKTITIGLESLSKNKWRPLRVACSTLQGNWFFIKLRGGNLIQLDIDAHTYEGNYQEEKSKVDHKLKLVCEYLDQKRISYIITSSPGDFFYHDDEEKPPEILHGYYIWIKTKKTYKAGSLNHLCNNLVKDIKEDTELTIEHCWHEQRSRNIRLFGQPYVNPVILKPDGKYECIYTYDPEVAVDSDIIQQRANNEWIRWKELKHSNLSRFELKTSALKKSCVISHFVTNETLKLESVDANAFKRLVGIKGKKNSIISQVVRKYKGDPKFLDIIVQEAIQKFREISVNGGFFDHVNNPMRLFKLVNRTAKWFVANYKHINPLEKESYAQYVVDIKDLKNTLVHAGYSKYQVINIIKIYKLCLQWNGSVAAKCIYGKYGVISKEEWLEIKDVFCIMREFSIKRKKCRRYMLLPSLLRTTKEETTKKDSICTLSQQKDNGTKCLLHSSEHFNKNDGLWFYLILFAKDADISHTVNAPIQKFLGVL